MAAEVESMFYTREKPWHGLGIRVDEAQTSKDALRLSGLDWKVEQETIYTEEGVPITGYQANIRDTDRKVLGGVTDRYKVVQNIEAFSFRGRCPLRNRRKLAGWQEGLATCKTSA